MNIFGLGGGQEAIICAYIKVNFQTRAYLLEWKVIKCIYNLGSNNYGNDFM